MSNTSHAIYISIWLLIALVGLPQISETIYTPALPAVAKSLHASAEYVEGTLAIYFIGFAIGVALWGALSDIWGRRTAMLAGLLCYIAATIGCALSTQIESLLAWRLLQAFGASVGSVITQTILRDIYTGTERAKLFSVMSGALAFSPAIGPLLGGFFSEWLGWRSNFLFLTLMGGIFLIWCWRALPETRPNHIVRPTAYEIRDLFCSMLTSKALLGHIILIGATNGIIFGFYQEAPFVFIDYLHVHPSHYGFIGLLIAGATIAAARISYVLAMRHSAHLIISAGSYLAIGGSLLYILTVWTGAFSEGVTGIVLAFIALFTIFLGIGLVIPNSLSHALKPYQHAVGTAGSIFGGCYYVIIAGLTGLMSLFHTGGPMPLPLFIGGLSVVLWLGTRMVSISSTAPAT